MNAALSTLTEHQRAVARRVLAHESTKRDHLVISLSGAHAYGFPSPDSDLDLKSVHVAPTRALLGFPRTPPPAERLEVIDGVEIDYSSNELGGVLLGLLKGNGNYFERFLSGFAVSTGPGFEAFVPLVQRSLSRRVARHYAGFAHQQREAWRAGGERSAKKLLYVLRTALTGTHVLRTGELVTDLPPVLSEKWAGRLDALFTGLAEAEASSVLPPEPDTEVELEAALIDARAGR